MEIKSQRPCSNNKERKLLPSKETEENEQGCCICLDDNGSPVNAIVYCDGPDCRVAAHQNCYGITNIPDGKWFCSPCTYRQQKMNKGTNVEKIVIII
jgi:hypothetical protein